MIRKGVILDGNVLIDIDFIGLAIMGLSSFGDKVTGFTLLVLVELHPAKCKSVSIYLGSEKSNESLWL
jgi:hypothetical protein